MHKALNGYMQSANKTWLNHVSQQVLSATCLVMQFLCLLVHFIIVVITDFHTMWLLASSWEPQFRSLRHAHKVHPSNKWEANRPTTQREYSM